MITLTNKYTRRLCTLIVAGTLSAATLAKADVVTDWNLLTQGFVNNAGRPAPTFQLDIAMVHIAIHDAVQAYDHRFRTYNAPIPNAAGSMAAAVRRSRSSGSSRSIRDGSGTYRTKAPSVCGNRAAEPR